MFFMEVNIGKNNPSSHGIYFSCLMQIYNTYILNFGHLKSRQEAILNFLDRKTRSHSKFGLITKNICLISTINFKLPPKNWG